MYSAFNFKKRGEYNVQTDSVFNWPDFMFVKFTKFIGFIVNLSLFVNLRLSDPYIVMLSWFLKSSKSKSKVVLETKFSLNIYLVTHAWLAQFTWY